MRDKITTLMCVSVRRLLKDLEVCQETKIIIFQLLKTTLFCWLYEIVFCFASLCFVAH